MLRRICLFREIREIREIRLIRDSENAISRKVRRVNSRKARKEFVFLFLFEIPCSVFDIFYWMLRSICLFREISVIRLIRDSDL
jgi:hypothetical protein